ncbi:MAG: PHP domain-containing protein [Endomicrobium sp.]|jgi:predicted metal-dependent phosphoesterase TrpH|nr:PHP domain-containing protein [Endomicrobium sp.]
MGNNLYVDMHIHTNYSDGVFTPQEAVEYASKIQLATISITDHDSVDGIDEALEIALKTGIEVIPGIELSSEVILDSQKSEMHVLGYYIDYKSEKLKNALVVLKKARHQRAIKILEKLKKNGAELKSKDFVKNAENKSIGRLHFAKALFEEGLVGSIQEAFQRYLAYDKPAYVPKYSVSAKEAINLILSVGGVPVIAHPYYIYYNDKSVFESLVKDGLMGIEAWHIKHPESAVKRFLSLAEEFNLLVTGGSDCHGPYKEEPPVMGKVKVPYSVVESLKNKLKI